MSEYRHLPDLIEKQFDVPELKELCFELGVDYDNITGSTKGGKAIELYKYFRRRGQEQKLLQAIHEARPETDLRPFGGPAPKIEQDQEEFAPASPPDWPRHNGEIIEYDNFDIFIRPTGNTNEYSLEAKSPYGETADSIRQIFPFENDAYRNLAHRLKDVRISETKYAQEMGEILRGFLFQPKIQELFNTSLNLARNSRKEGVRVRININQESGELYQVPWEYCRDDKSFLAINDDTPLVRYMPTNREPTPISVPDKVKILLAWANPKNLVQLKVQSEIDAVKEALADLTSSGKIVIDELPNATPAELFSRVSRNPPHIFHFIGHGELKPGGGGALALEGSNDKHVLVDGNLMLDLFQGNDTKLIILSACQTGATSDKSEKSSSAEAFMGLAPKLVWGGLPAVVAMQYDLPDVAAKPFMKTLYDFLAMGKPLDWAITKARLGLRFTILESPHWGIPVLFMRAPDGNIWA